MAKGGVTADQLAEVIQVDPKTIDRWVAGRMPQRANRLRVAHALDADEAYLWPSTQDDPRTLSATRAELTDFFQSRGQVPVELWMNLIDGARESIDVLAFAATFLHDTVPEAGERLGAAVDRGVHVRFLFGNPTSAAVRTRGDEEGIGELLAGRCQLTWSYLRPLIGRPGVEARRHSETLYASLFRFDADLLSNHHLLGLPASQSPVFHFQHIPGGRLFRTHMKSFENTWDRADPVV